MIKRTILPVITSWLLVSGPGHASPSTVPHGGLGGERPSSPKKGKKGTKKKKERDDEGGGSGEKAGGDSGQGDREGNPGPGHEGGGGDNKAAPGHEGGGEDGLPIE